MDLSILLVLVQDGIVNGAIYGLLALALVIVFTVTRIIWVPIGEFVSFGALTLAMLEAGQMPGTVALTALLGLGAAAARLWAARARLTPAGVARCLLTALLPAGLAALLAWACLAWGAPQPLRILAALAIVTPMAPFLYDTLYRPMAGASVLVLLIASVALHLALQGLGLIFFGAEGSRTESLADSLLEIGPLLVTGQSLIILAVTLVLIAALALFFGHTLLGKALRATAVNRLGARLVAIPPALCGHVAFTLAGGIAALGGILISATTTLYYDTGFLIALKGFVAAVIGGLASYPLAALGALLIGLVESFAAFNASAFKEVLVFMIIIPVLLWRSWRMPAALDEGEE
ncbi:branched-chain amino acid ABC transporter permease [Roseomonas sp. GC11]|uniref:branched-chain amino acid ABC transporter permease n=1 Tax=Roseomonas sp. GC11 TaxID=2950546 RepID=UPI00210CB70B|nr:branched-chain amino acid ABC transporter permease [Roseomonas sp. GC11]MCQ4160022.1 branched-chain amino acid ABC transporter permease [Roseomonas sp. GC11]